MLSSDPRPSNSFDISAFSRKFEDDVKLITQTEACIDKTRALNIIYPLIDPHAVNSLRSLSKKQMQSFVNSVLAICNRSGLELTKLEAQTLFALDPVSRSYNDSDLPLRALQKNIFTNLSIPIRLEDLNHLDIEFDTQVMSLMVNGELIEGVVNPLSGYKYTVFQLLRDPFSPDVVHLRGSRPVVESEKIIKKDDKGLYFQANENEAFALKDKALIFILES